MSVWNRCVKKRLRRLFIIVVSCGFAFLFDETKASAQGILVNGGFESPEIPLNTSQDVDPDGWTRLTDGSGITHLFNGNGGITGVPFPHGGSQQFLLGYSGTGISQTVAVGEHSSYRISWWTATDAAETSVPMTYNIRVWNMEADSLVVSNQFVAQPGFDWTHESSEINLPAGVYNIEFRSVRFFNGYGIFLDDVSLTPVPEPGAILLSAVGILFLMTVRTGFGNAQQVRPDN